MIKISNRIFSKCIAALFLAFTLGLQNLSVLALHEDFTYITDVTQNVILEPRYFSTYNFIGERIEGYNSP